MASQFLDMLQQHGQLRENGKLEVNLSEGKTEVYLYEGDVVYAQGPRDGGICALFVAMASPQLSVVWRPGLPPPHVAFRHPFDALLFQYAQLEDAGLAHEEGIRAEFGNQDERTPPQVKLLDLSNYVVSFEVLNTAFKGFVFFLESKETLLGRFEDCDVILPDGSVSSHHCKIVQDASVIRVVDLGSTNGTRINGELISEAILQVGDSFQVGQVEITMNIKLKRKLDERAIQLMEAQARMLHKAPATPVTSQTKKTTTSKISGAITWKNVGGATPPQKKTGSLFGGLFRGGKK
jgi:pSer/pThr/pTyr-binding forkhead associated (FHA) protein